MNTDETGLYYRALPKGTLAHKPEPVSGSKKAMDRISVLFACNMTGTEKLTPLVIGSSKNPRCFRGKHNCTAHPHDVDLRNIRLVFLPANNTSIIQPLDQGIIRNFKALYRSQLMQRVLNDLDCNGNILNAQQMAKATTGAWRNVQLTTIKNCFRKAGLTAVQSDDHTPQPADIVPTPEGMTEEEFTAFVDMDADVECTGDPTDEELCQDKGKYPEGYSKKQKRTLRQRAQDHGVLYYRGSRGKTGQPRQVIGEKDVQKRVIKQCHEGGDGLAHFGRDKTRQKLEARFYWAGMYQDLVSFIESCDKCQRQNRTLKMAKPPLHPVSVHVAVSRT
ncbi:Tigger transposable element-derived protein 4 [Branchiostoma belcheri]|nr:Tigger transposable element-derived protein 4 [Branchiostoma belcheri]